MNTLDFLRANEHKSREGFVSKAQYLKDNWSWLKYSYCKDINKFQFVQIKYCFNWSGSSKFC